MRLGSSTPADDVTRRQSVIMLVVLVGLGLALRSVAIGRESLWSDEALTAVLVHYPWWSFPFTSVDSSPPLFYWLEKALVPEGASPATWRMVSLVAGVATVPLTYWLGRELKSRGAGLVAAGLVAVSAPLVDYSQEARAYALAVGLIAGSAASLAALTGGRLAGEGRTRERRLMLAIFATFTTLAIFTHFIALLWVLAALVIMRLAADGERRQVDPREMLATILVVVPFLAIELRRLVLYRSEQDGFSWLSQMSPAKMLHVLGEQWLPFAKAAGWPVMLVGAGLVLALLWSARGGLFGWARSRPLQLLIVAALLLEPLGLWLIGQVAAPVAMARTFLPASIGFAALVGVAVASLNRTSLIAIGTAIIGVSLVSTLIAGTTRHKEQWAGASAATGDAPLVITCANWKTPSFLAQTKANGWVVTSSGNKALIVRQPGDTASWDRLYFERVQRYAHYPLRRDRPLRLERQPITAKRLLFVASECSAIERRAFAKWADLRGSRLLWSSPRVAGAADITVEEWRLGGAAPLDLWIVR
ncbi:MAG: glycosyltransferase family 39 protein [Sphingomonas bacterium]|nr:glycosyltransferase family 39 protein [Sphingomonas bacterium]